MSFRMTMGNKNHVVVVVDGQQQQQRRRCFAIVLTTVLPLKEEQQDEEVRNGPKSDPSRSNHSVGTLTAWSWSSRRIAWFRFSFWFLLFLRLPVDDITTGWSDGRSAIHDVADGWEFLAKPKDTKSDPFDSELSFPLSLFASLWSAYYSNNTAGTSKQTATKEKQAFFSCGFSFWFVSLTALVLQHRICAASKQRGQTLETNQNKPKNGGKPDEKKRRSAESNRGWE